MATRMTDTDPTLRRDEVVERPVVWPWVLLAVVIALALYWAAANHNNAGAPTTAPGIGTSGAPITAPSPSGSNVPNTAPSTVPNTAPAH